ncbi:MAG: DUF3108 domain-containing protein [bacterium]|nr:DUF3108 domain-containing protein [bacterium]
MRVFLRVFFALGVFVVGGLYASGQGSGILQPGEELVYRVSYLNVTLGTVKSIVQPYTTLDGRTVGKIKVVITSHPNIPFVSLNSVYESWIDTSATFSYKFNANTLQGDGTWSFEQYFFDYTTKKATIEKYWKKELVSKKEFTIKKRYNDGSSLLFAARALLRDNKGYKLRCVIMDDTVNTLIDYTGKRENVEIDAASYPVRTVYFAGDADWTGVYGLTGRFEGWFSDDEACIPIKAKMRVYVGSVSLELVSWKRNNWQPPKAN